MKRGRRILLIVASCAIVAVVAIFVWPGEREPEYQGKKLSEWLELYHSQFHIDQYRDTPEFRQASVAVRHIGTNAIPFLLKWIRYERPAWRYRVHSAVTRIGYFRTKHTDKVLLGGRDAFLARVGFEILGSDAIQAGPVLAELSNDPASPQTCRNAIVALGALGGEALPPLMGIFTNQAIPFTRRFWAGTSMINHASALKTGAAPWVPTLVQCLKDRESSITAEAAAILGEWGLEGPSVVPALVECLQTGVSRPNILWSLGEFGRQAAPAAPAIRALTNDSDFGVRTMAVQALQKIAPEVLQTNGVSGR